MSLITVVIPFRNRAESFGSALLSIKKQTYRPIELIIVDNGSTDSARKVASDFAKSSNETDFSIRLIDEPSQGAAHARNKGLQIAQGEYIYFFDSDDLMSADFLSDAESCVLHHDLDCACCRTTMLLPGGRRHIRDYCSKLTAENQILTGQLSTQSMLMRTSFLRSIGGWNANLPVWNDYELGLRAILSTSRIAWIRKQPYHSIIYRDDSLTARTKDPHNARYLWLALDAMRADLDRHAASPVTYRALRFRTAITAARLHVDEPELSYPAPISTSMRLSLSLCRWLTRCRVRGVWRVALTLSHIAR